MGRRACGADQWAGRLALVALLLSAGVAPAGAAEGRMESDAAIARAGDGTYLVFRAGGGELRAHLGRPDPDSLDLSLDEGTPLVAKEGAVLQAGAADPAVAAVVTPGDVLFLAWAQEGRAFLTSCSLKGDAKAKRALDAGAYAGRRELGAGRPTGAALDARSSFPVFVGVSPAGGGTVWVSRARDGNWTCEALATGQGEVRPQAAVSASGTAHVVWRDGGGAVWHLESRDGGAWLRSGSTSHQPERVGTASGEPALACARHQVLVAMPGADDQIEYSLYTGQSWERNLPLTATDRRWSGEKLGLPRLLLDGRGVPWLFFINHTRRYAYTTRWLGFGWDTIREGRGIFHVGESFLQNQAPIRGCRVPAFVAPGREELGLLLMGDPETRPLRAHRMATPAPVARAGTDILFLDMLDVGRSLWVEQVPQQARKHPGNPLLRHSGDPQAVDSHRVFNYGIIHRDAEGYQAWYAAGNPTGDWNDWQSLLHLAYATSKDGVAWEKPKLGLLEFRGSRENNGIAGLNTYLPVMPNPDTRDPERRFLGFRPGQRTYSADGLRWKGETAACAFPGPKPVWFVYDSVMHDPEAPASRRWRAYGCMAPHEPRRACGYAYSADGRHFTAHPENPVIQAETGSQKTCHNIVAWKYKGHTLALYQTGMVGYAQHLELAVSRDGEHFVRVGDGRPLIAQGEGDAWDRGLHIPSQPLVVDGEIRLYYGAADYQAPTDSPFDYERWKGCRMGMGLATLPLDGWAYLRNTGDRHIGYVTTVPMRVQDLRGCVLALNAQASKETYLLAELLAGDSDDRIPGYEHESCDLVTGVGPGQVVSWGGRSGLEGVKAATVRVRVILRGKGDGLRLYSIGFRKAEGAEAPKPAGTVDGLVEKALVYRSSVSDLAPLKAWMAYRPDGKPKPVIVAMHGYGDPVLRHGGRRMAGTVRSYAQRGLFALAVDLRGREESAGQRDDGGLEVMDIYDAVQAALRQYPGETDPESVHMIGWSGGGGNVFSAVTRMPDLFSSAAAFYGITDYGHWAETTFREVVPPNVGGSPKEVPDRYLARNSLLGAANNAYTAFHFFWDERERICPPWMDTEYRRLAAEAGLRNVTAHESKAADAFRWLHEGMSRESAVEAERICMPLVMGKRNPSPRLRPEGKLMVLGFLMTQRFQVLVGQGNDAVAELSYGLSPGEYRFSFARKSSDGGARGQLRITDRKPEEVAEVTLDGKRHPWEKEEGILVRDVPLDATVVVRFR